MGGGEHVVGNGNVPRLLRGIPFDRTCVLCVVCRVCVCVCVCVERVRRAASCVCRVLNVSETADGKNTRKSLRTAARRAAELVVRKGRRKDEFRSFRCRALCRIVRMETLLPVRMRLGAHNTLSQTQRN